MISLISGEDVMRLFTAIPFEDSVCDEIESLTYGLRGARWIARENFHLTLTFLGENNPIVLRELQFSLQKIRTKPFNIDIQGLGIFPPKGESKTLWLGVKPNEELNHLEE